MVLWSLLGGTSHTSFQKHYKQRMRKQMENRVSSCSVWPARLRHQPWRLLSIRIPGHRENRAHPTCCLPPAFWVSSPHVSKIYPPACLQGLLVDHPKPGTS